MHISEFGSHVPSNTYIMPNDVIVSNHIDIHSIRCASGKLSPAPPPPPPLLNVSIYGYRTNIHINMITYTRIFTSRSKYHWRTTHLTLLSVQMIKNIAIEVVAIMNDWTAKKKSFIKIEYQNTWNQILMKMVRLQMFQNEKCSLIVKRN